MTITVANTWPECIPLPYIQFTGTNNYASIITDINPFVRSLRNRFQKNYPVLSLVWNISEYQRRLFSQFFYDTLGNGTSQFQLPLRYPYNNALENWAVRFVDSYKATLVDRFRYQVTADIELMQDLGTQTALYDTKTFDDTNTTWDDTNVTFDTE